MLQSSLSKSQLYVGIGVGRSGKRGSQSKTVHQDREHFFVVNMIEVDFWSFELNQSLWPIHPLQMLSMQKGGIGEGGVDGEL